MLAKLRNSPLLAKHFGVSVALATAIEAASICMAYAAPKIELNGPLAPLFSIAPNQNHGYMTELCGYRHISQNSSGCGNFEPYGAWADGPMNPYKYGVDTYFQIPMSENFRIKIPNHYWGGPTTWTMEPASITPSDGGASITPAQRDQLEPVYNNRNWIFSAYVIGSNIYGLTHHEWYRFSQTIGGIAGFDSKDAQGIYKPWIASIGWVKSTNGGASWSMKPKTDYSSRLVVVPEPSATGYPYAAYGFMHPSNIVKEGNYYYFFTSTANYRQGPNSLAQRQGVSLFRNTTLAGPLGWEYWNGSGWTTINHNTYQGNDGVQQPYVFWQKQNPCSHLYAMNVRKHVTSGKWITLGSKYCLPIEPDGSFRYQAVFSWTSNLSNPIDLEKRDDAGNIIIDEVVQNGQSLLSNNYYSFFDASGGSYVGKNYEFVGNNPLLIVTKDYSDYYHQYLTLSGF